MVGGALRLARNRHLARTAARARTVRQPPRNIVPARARPVTTRPATPGPCPSRGRDRSRGRQLRKAMASSTSRRPLSPPSAVHAVVLRKPKSDRISRAAVPRAIGNNPFGTTPRSGGVVKAADLALITQTPTQAAITMADTPQGGLIGRRTFGGARSSPTPPVSSPAAARSAHANGHRSSRARLRGRHASATHRDASRGTIGSVHTAAGPFRLALSCNPRLRRITLTPQPREVASSWSLFACCSREAPGLTIESRRPSRRLER